MGTTWNCHTGIYLLFLKQTAYSIATLYDWWFDPWWSSPYLSMNQHSTKAKWTKPTEWGKVVKLECIYFITVYLWTTFGSNSLGGGGGLLMNLELYILYYIILYIYIYPFSASFKTMGLHQVMVAASCCFPWCLSRASQGWLQLRKSSFRP